MRSDVLLRRLLLDPARISALALLLARQYENKAGYPEIEESACDPRENVLSVPGSNSAGHQQDAVLGGNAPLLAKLCHALCSDHLVSERARIDTGRNDCEPLGGNAM